VTSPADFLSPKGMPPKSSPDDLIGRWLFDGAFPLPVAILRREHLESNIAAMAAFCADYGLLIAPHAKTMMSSQLIERQMRAGAWGMTVATAWQAAQVAAMGVQRILIANQVADRGSVALLERILVDCPELHVWCYVDSIEVLSGLANLSPFAERLGILIELGMRGGRTGVRETADALNLARRVTEGPFHLAGFSAYEGLIGGSDLAEAIALVDDFLRELASLALAAWELGLLSEEGSPMVTVGGSTYPDRVAICLAPVLTDLPIDVILRSGCYVSHDSLSYEACSPFGRSQRLPYRLQEALEVWAPILSVPEPGKAIASMGRRDCSFDAGLPVARRLLSSSGSAPISLALGSENPIAVTALNDQHAYLDLNHGFDLQVGDLIGFGISHPCTTFDKWGMIPIVDQGDVVVDLATTRFT